MHEYVLTNYIDDNNQEPIKIWLKSLDGSFRKRVLLRLDRLRNGNFGDYKQLNNYLYELRFDFGAGYRIYYTIQNQTIILLINGGDKKSQSKDIKHANEILEKLKGIQNEECK